MTGLSRAEEALVHGLARRKVREAEGLFLAEGVRVVEELLDSPLVPRLALVSPDLEETDRGRLLLNTLRDRTVVRQVTDAQLARLADTSTSQGVLVAAGIPRPALPEVAPGDDACALVLDGVQDPGNLGTLARSAVAFGCDLVACLPGTVDPWNPKAVRSAAGALFRTAVLTTPLGPLAEWLEDGDFMVLGADAAGESVEAVPLGPRVALVLGNEGAGLTAAARARAGRIVAVPMRGATESLNVAVAGGILLYLITRERR